MVPIGEIAVTWAPSSTPLRALSVTVAACPTFTLVTSDSLRATVIVIVLELTIWTNGVAVAPAEAEPVPLVELEPPRPPAAVVPPPPVLPVELLEAEPDAADVEPADTESPAVSPAIEAIVPLTGA